MKPPLVSFPPEFPLSNAAYVLSRSDDASMIDRLNNACRFVRSMMLSGEGRQEMQQFSQQIKHLSEVTGEPTLQAATRLLLPTFPPSHLPSDYDEFLVALDAYTEGRFNDAIPRLHALILRHPTAFAPYALSAKAHAHVQRRPEKCLPEWSIASIVLSELTEIMIGKGSTKEHLDNLLGLALDLGENHLAFGILDQVSDLLGVPDTGERAALNVLSSKFPDPFADFKLSGGLQRNNLLLEMHPWSTTLRFQKYRGECKLNDEGDTLTVKRERLLYYQATEQIAKGQTELGISKLRALHSESISSTDTAFAELRQSTAALYNAFVSSNDLNAACRLVVKSCMRNPVLSRSLDLNKLEEKLEQCWWLKPEEQIYIPILTWLCKRDDFAVYKAADRFLRANNCKCITDVLRLEARFPHDAYCLLIGEVLREDIIALAWRYSKDYSSVELQRIDLCAYLARAGDPNHIKFVEEAKAITKRRSVRNVLKQRAERKVQIDLPRIKSLLFSNRALFERRQLFLSVEKDAPLEQLDSSDLASSTSLDEASCTTGTSATGPATKMMRESDQLLKTFLIHCYSVFLWDSDFCLNFLLSADVRHGFLKNHLRKPFQNHNIILFKRKDGIYLQANKWLKKLEGNISEEEMLKVSTAFTLFSEGIDSIISHLNNVVMQIRVGSEQQERFADLRFGAHLKGNTAGYFDYEAFFDRMTTDRKDELDHAESFEHFIDICLNELVALTDLNFRKVRHFLRGTVAFKMSELNDDFLAAVQSALNNPKLRAALLTDIKAAHEEATSELLIVAEWFQVAEKSIPADTRLSELVDTVASLVASCRPRMHGERFFTYPSQPAPILIAGHAVSAVFDVLYILLDNVAEYSEGDFSRPLCQIEILGTSICVKNFVRDHETAEKQASKAKALLKRERNQIADTEGNSGLAKISRILMNGIGHGPLEIDVWSSKESFNVKVTLPPQCYPICES